jgi:hypothetical protein
MPEKQYSVMAPVRPERVSQGKLVYLSRDLPLGFGNRYTIVAHPRDGTQRVGVVTSKGFEAGILHVLFDMHHGKEQTRFNVLSAEKYLECDPYR